LARRFGQDFMSRAEGYRVCESLGLTLRTQPREDGSSLTYIAWLGQVFDDYRREFHEGRIAAPDLFNSKTIAITSSV